MDAKIWIKKVIRKYYFGIVSPVSKEDLKVQVTRGWDNILGNSESMLALILYTTLGASALKQVVG